MRSKVVGPSSTIKGGHDSIIFVHTKSFNAPHAHNINQQEDKNLYGKGQADLYNAIENRKEP